MTKQSWAQRIDEQDQKIAERMYEADLAALKALGPQPLDAATGEAIGKTPEAEKTQLYAMMRDNDELMLAEIAKEALRLELSGGVLPREMLEGIPLQEKHYLQASETQAPTLAYGVASPVLGEIEGLMEGSESDDEPV